MVKNEGQIPQYYVENSHPPIISIEMFEMVQQELAKNARFKQGRSNASCFSNRVICGECGEYYVARTWHSQDIYKRKVWQCGGKYSQRGGPGCQTPHLTEEQLQSVFVEAFNRVIGDKERYIEALAPVIEFLTDTSGLETESQIMQERSAGIYAQMEALVADNAQHLRNQDEYQKRYDDLEGRYEIVRKRLEEITAEKQARQRKKENILCFIDTLRGRESLLTEFDEGIFRATVEETIVLAKDKITVRFRDGREI
jgi:hypothetical protein